MESWISEANKRFGGGQTSGSSQAVPSWVAEANKRFPAKPTPKKTEITRINQFGIIGKDKRDINQLFNDVYKKTTSTQEVTKPTNKEIFSDMTSGVSGIMDKFIDNVKNVSNRVNSVINKVQKLNKDTADKLTSTVIQEVTKNGLIGMLINPESVGLKKGEQNQFTIANNGIKKLGSGEKMSDNEIKAFSNIILGIVDFGASNLPKKSKPIIDDITNRVAASSDDFAKTLKMINDPTFKAESYVAEQVSKQQAAAKASKGGVKQNISNFFAKLKSELVDTNAPIEDILGKAQKAGGYEILESKNITNAIDRVKGRSGIVSMFVRDNGLEKVIQNVDNLDNLNQYLIAKQSIFRESKGIKTGRDLAKDNQLVSAFNEKYEPFAKQVYDYSRKLLDYSVDSKLISRELADKLIKDNPSYVPLNRIFAEIEDTILHGGNAVASLSSQSVVKKIKGSEREIEDPVKSLLDKTVVAITEGEKNKTASLFGDYIKLPGNPLSLRELKDGERIADGMGTVSFLDNGVKRTFETTKEIAEAAKVLTKQQMGIMGKILSPAVRILKLGTTGIQPAFAIPNLIKDQVAALINSKAATSIGNPKVFVQSLFEAFGHGKVYKEMLREGAMQTSFDIARNEAVPTIAKIRAGKSAGSKIAFTISHPKEWLRTIENVVNRLEEVTRIQNFIGTKNNALGKGVNELDATLKAAGAARTNSVNFSRSGSWMQQLNYVIPYLNANVQGTRTFVRAMKDRPVQTSAKIATLVFMPVAATTAWNLSDPKRKEAYDDIAEWEKQNNIIIIPDNPTKNEDGTWNIIKIPLSQEVNNIAGAVRRPMEQAYGLNPVTIQDMANAFIGSVSPVGTTPGQIMSTIVPQAIKPTVEYYTNKDLYTGLPTVPRSLEKLSPELQTKDTTSGSAEILAGAINKSPLKVEKFIKSTFGTAGPQVLNAVDKVLAGVDIIPKDKIGGKDLAKSIVARFNSATGGAKDNESNSTLEGIIQKQSDENFRLKQEAETVYAEFLTTKKADNEKKLIEIKKANPLLYDKLVDVIQQGNLGLTYNDRLLMQLGVDNGERAKFLYETMKSMTPEEKTTYFTEMRRKKIISDNVYRQLLYLNK